MNLVLALPGLIAFLLLNRWKDAVTSNNQIVRKNIVALRNISKGEDFTEENITVKRFGAGISPMKWDHVIGKTAKGNFQKDRAIKL